MRALIVEDHQDTSESLSMCLRLMGHRAEAAASAEAALILLGTGRYNCLAVDYFLAGGIDGVQLIRRLRATAQYRDLPVVLMTAAGGDLVDQIARDLESLQPAAILKKPFYPMQFVDAMQVLRGAGSPPAAAREGGAK